jgi:transposase
MVAMDSGGRIVEKKKFSRTQLLNHLANKETVVIGMEGCSGAHFLAKALSRQGHAVRLMPAQ